MKSKTREVWKNIVSGNYRMRRVCALVCMFGLCGWGCVAGVGGVAADAGSDVPTSDLGVVDVFVASDGGEDVFDAPPPRDLVDTSDVEVAVAPILAPQPIGPLSTEATTSDRPTFRVRLLGSGVDGARVEVCETRACTAIQATFDLTRTDAGSMVSGRPSSALSPGRHFWRVRGRSGSQVGTATSPVWGFFVRRPLPTRTNDTSWGTIVDVNGDGFADLAVGDATRAVYVHQGSSSRGVSPTPDWVLRGPDGPNQDFGYSVASGGDIDGDGYGDLLVSTQGGVSINPDAGVFSQAKVFIYRGGAVLSSDGGVLPDGGISSGTSITLSGIPGRNGYRTKVIAAGDLDRDGHGDFVVSIVDPDSAQSRIEVYRGDASGGATRSQEVALSEFPGARNCGAVASACDVDGDGYSDLVVGCSVTMAFRARVFLNDGTGRFTSSTNLGTNVVDGGVTETDGFGYSVACGGDLNGDGLADIVVGAYGTSGGGAAYVYRGRARSAWGSEVNPEFPVLVGRREANGYFGDYLASVDDMNSDGFDELAVSADNENRVADATMNGLGRVYIFTGGPSGLSNDPARRLEIANTTIPGFGSSIAGGGDTDGNGAGELFVGWRSMGQEVRGYRFNGGVIVPAIGTPLPVLAMGGLFGQHLAAGSSQSP